MSTPDSVPRTDADFNIWQTSLIVFVGLNIIGWGIPETDYANLQAKQVNWTTDYSKASNKQNRTAADVTAKDDSRLEYEKVLRPFIAQWLSNNGKVSDSERTRMGINNRSTTRTAAAKPTSCPVGNIDFSVRRQHTIHFYDEGTARSKAKPAGVHGCEIYIKIDGEAPKDISEMTYLTTDTATPYLMTFDGNKAGKTAYYWLRWVNTRSEFGPWSSTVSAMIVG